MRDTKMSKKKEAFKLIIENIQMFDDASNLLDDEFDGEIFEAIDSVIKNFESKWENPRYFTQDRYSIFYPPEWIAPNQNKSENFYAHYYIDFGYKESEKERINYWDITALFSDVEGIVLGFYSYGRQFLKCGTKDWKVFMSEQYKLYPKLQQLGFKHNVKGGSFYLPINPLNDQLIIKNYPDSLRDAMEPIREALNTLKEAHPIFDEIVEAAKNKFGTN